MYRKKWCLSANNKQHKLYSRRENEKEFFVAIPSIIQSGMKKKSYIKYLHASSINVISVMMNTRNHTLFIVWIFSFSTVVPFRGGEVNKINGNYYARVNNGNIHTAWNIIQLNILMNLFEFWIDKLFIFLSPFHPFF